MIKKSDGGYEVTVNLKDKVVKVDARGYVVNKSITARRG